MLNQADLARAIEYPYNIPWCSYRVEVNNATFRELPDLKIIECEETSEPDRYDITLSSEAGIAKLNKVYLVVAAGSNASPVQLLQKYSNTSVQAIYCLRAKFSGIAPVYSAHFTKYGAIAACLVPFPSAEGHLFVSFLDEVALKRMHATESLGINYEFKRLKIGKIKNNFCDRAVTMYYYKSLRGPIISKSNIPILLSAFDFCDSQAPCLSERQLLEAVSSAFAPGVSAEKFIEGIVTNEEERILFTNKLKELRI